MAGSGCSFEESGGSRSRLSFSAVHLSRYVALQIFSFHLVFNKKEEKALAEKANAEAEAWFDRVSPFAFNFRYLSRFTQTETLFPVMHMPEHNNSVPLFVHGRLGMQL